MFGDVLQQMIAGHYAMMDEDVMATLHTLVNILIGVQISVMIIILSLNVISSQFRYYVLKYSI